MTNMIVEIMVEVINILAIATKEVKSGRLSELVSFSFPTFGSQRHIFRKVFEENNEKYGHRG